MLGFEKDFVRIEVALIFEPDNNELNNLLKDTKT